MNQRIIKKTNWNEMKELLTEYFTELGYKNDAFHNSMLLEGEAYAIQQDGKKIGFFSLGDSWDKVKLLRGFYLQSECRNQSIEIFEEVIKKAKVEAALVPSNDALYISLAFEKMKALDTTFDMQAMNFTYGEPTRPAEYGPEYLVEANEEDMKVIRQSADGLWDGCYEDPDFTYYAIKSDGVALGYGAIGKHKYNDKNVDLGNFALAKHRKKGVGRSLIINMAKVAIAKGYTPTAGCWYGNKNSIATLKSSGFKPENRIFYVRFK